MSSLSIHVFGLPRIELDGRPIRIDRHKSLALAAYLAMNPRPQSRDTLATLLWPEYDQNAARSSLSNCLWQLKKLLGREWLISEREEVGINPGNKPWVDAHEFKSLLEECGSHGHAQTQTCAACVTTLVRAAALYQDEFMAGFHVADCDTYEEWKTAQADKLNHEFTNILAKLVFYYETREEYEPGLHYAKLWLKADPLDEEAHWHLMLLLARSGHPAPALRQYEECRRLLSEELNTEPQEKLKKLQKEIRQQHASAGAEAYLGKNHFKKPSESFLQPVYCIGRDKELKAIVRVLNDPRCRFLTLVGPGGIGKTTLALQAAHEMKRSFNGTFFIPLVHLTSSEWIVPAIADAVGLSFYRNAVPRHQLIDYLREKSLLLILDNFEHLLDGGELLAEIMDKAPQIKLLVASQQPLNLRAEWIFQVRGLSFPPDDSLADFETYDSVRLFLENVQRVNQSFAPVEEEKKYIAGLCRFLSGMPLGIELAAAWTRMLPCKGIWQELQRDPGSLASSLEGVPDRQHCLRSMFEYSWKLFSDEERRTLKKLSVFRGGFSMEAALGLAGNVMPIMLSIMNKSFLTKNISGRYVILEILRSFIHEKALQNPEEMETLQRWHSDYYSRLVCEQVKGIEGEDKEKILSAMGLELDNLREGWRWAVSRREYRMMKHYLDGLFEFYREKGWFLYGEQTLSETLAVTREIQDRSPEAEATIAKMLSVRGWCCHYLARPDQAQKSLREAISIFRRLDQKQDLARSCYRLGYDLFFAGQLEEAEDLLREGFSIFETAGNRMGMTDCRRLIGNIKSVQGKFDEAREAFDESLAAYRELGNITGICYVYDCLGIMLESQGNCREAIRIHERSIAYYWRIEEGWGMANSLNNLGFACFANNEFERSEECFKKAIQLTIRNQVVPILQESLTGMAFCLAQQGKKEPALEIAAYIAQDATVLVDARKRAERLLRDLSSQFAENHINTIMLKVRSKSLQFYLDLLFREQYL